MVDDEIQDGMETTPGPSGRRSSDGAGGVLVARPWAVAAAVVLPTFMEVLDTTIAVVALRYIAGGLSATVVDGKWVIASYLAANAIILPMTGWLTTCFGRRNNFLASNLIFTISSWLCGMATSLYQLILFRVIQGLAGSGLQPRLLLGVRSGDAYACAGGGDDEKRSVAEKGVHAGVE
jgi:hypothetical protein